MTDVGVSLAIIGSVCFGGSIAWLAWEAFSAPIRDDWETCTKARDRQHRDRIAAGAQSFREALALSDMGCAEYVAANSDKPIMTYGDWPSITEEELVSIHNGDKQ